MWGDIDPGSATVPEVFGFLGVSASCRLVLRSLSPVPHSNLSQGTLDADLKDPLLIARLIEDAVDGAVVVPRPNQALKSLKFESPGSENAVEELRRGYGAPRFRIFICISVQVGHLEVVEQSLIRSPMYTFHGGNPADGKPSHGLGRGVTIVGRHRRCKGGAERRCDDYARRY